MLFLHEYELTLSDNTVALDTWHYFTPLEVARPLTWLTVGLPVRGMPRYASLLVRADKGYNMGYLDGYGECFVTSDAITAGVLRFHWLYHPAKILNTTKILDKKPFTPS